MCLSTWSSDWLMNFNINKWALVQFRTGPKPDGIKHTVQSHTPLCCACMHQHSSASALFRQSSARCETALAPNSVRFCQSQESASLGYMNTSFSMRSSQGSTSTSILGSRSRPTFVGINTAKPSETKLAVPWASFVEHYHHALRK